MAHSEVETLPEVLEQPDVMPGSQENTPQKTEAAAVVQEREDIFVENADRHAEVVAQLLDTFHLAAHCDAGVGQQFIDVGCGPGNLTLQMPGSQENTPQKTEAAAVVQEREDIFVENADRHAEVVAQLLDTFHLAAHCDAGVGQQFIDVGCGPGNLTLQMPGSQENTPQKTEAAAVVQEREDIFVENGDLHAEVVAQLLDTFHLAAHCDAGVGQQFIDVECGPGNLTLHYLLPRLPPCRRLVAVDQSPVLLKAAKEKYSHPKIEYLQLDILDDVDGFVREQGQFQRLYSFATLHWVRDQRRAMRHIEKLMAPGGECMLLFKWTAYFMHLYDAMTKSPRWAKYSNLLAAAAATLPKTCGRRPVSCLAESCQRKVLAS
ncbi:uncharacterized protein LOC144101768 isoform X3 [Amblyomma americanum]